MTASLRVFVSSVQKELEDERLIVQNLVNTDPFLAALASPFSASSSPHPPRRHWMDASGRSTSARCTC